MWENSTSIFEANWENYEESVWKSCHCLPGGQPQILNVAVFFTWSFSFLHSDIMKHLNEECDLFYSEKDIFFSISNFLITLWNCKNRRNPRDPPKLSFCRHSVVFLHCSWLPHSELMILIFVWWVQFGYLFKTSCIQCNFLSCAEVCSELKLNKEVTVWAI